MKHFCIFITTPKYWKSLNFICLGLLIIQFLLIVFINLFRNVYHLGTDASMLYLKAIEISKYRTLLPPFFRNSYSSLGFDSPVLLSSFLYTVTDNIYLSFGITNIIVTILLIILFAINLKEAGNTETTAFILSLNLLLSPFIVIFYAPNPIYDILSLLYVSAAFWGVRVLTGFLCIHSFFILYERKQLTKKHLAVIVLSLFLLFICAVSSSLYILIVYIIPIILFVFCDMLKTSNIKVLYNRGVILTFIMVIIAFIGRYISRNIFWYKPVSESTALISGELFFNNIQSIYIGFLTLLNGIRYKANIPIFSYEGIMTLNNFALANFVIFSFIGVLVYIHKNKIVLSNYLFIHILIVIFNLFVFILSYTTYSGGAFESRYLIPALVSMYIVTGVFMSHILANNKFAKKTLFIILFIMLSLSNYTSWKTYNNAAMDDHIALAKQIDKYDCEVVYIADHVTAYNLRTLDTDRIYHYCVFSNNKFMHVLKGFEGYTYYEDTENFTGKSLLIIPEAYYNNLPPYIRENHTLLEAADYADWNIYQAVNMTIDSVFFDRWKKSNGIWYFYKEDGALARGEWLNWEGEWYYLDAQTGAMLYNGTYIIDGIEYTFDENGVCNKP